MKEVITLKDYMIKNNASALVGRTFINENDQDKVGVKIIALHGNRIEFRGVATLCVDGPINSVTDSVSFLERFGKYTLTEQEKINKET